MIASVQLYALTGRQPDKTWREVLMVYHNTKRIYDEPTGVKYTDFDLAMEEVGRKNTALAQAITK